MVLEQEENWFGPRLKFLRETAGLTQLKLAEEMSVSLQTVREWERGDKFPHLRRLPQLAALLDAEPGDFFPVRQPNEGAMAESGRERSEQNFEQYLQWLEERLTAIVRELRSRRSPD